MLHTLLIIHTIFFTLGLNRKQASAITSLSIAINRPAYQSMTLDDRFGNNSVDGNYDNTTPNNCSTIMYGSSSLGFLYVGRSNWWLVDLGDLYAITKVVVYNAGFLPDKLFFRDLEVHASSPLSSWFKCDGSRDISQSNSWTANCNLFVYGQYVRVSKSPDTIYSRFTICEVDVYGAKLINKIESLSYKKPTTQSATYGNRIASNANDGNSDGDNVENCATAVAYHPYFYLNAYCPVFYSDSYNPNNVYAWWQVDLQEWSAVYYIVLYVPSGSPDRLYVNQQFSILITRESNLTTSDVVTCNTYSSSYCTTTNTSINCTCYRWTTAYYGRYVTVKQTPSLYMEILTLCEVEVYGSKLQVNPNYTDSSVQNLKYTPPSSQGNICLSSDESTNKAIAIAALVIACVAMLCVLVLIALEVQHLRLLLKQSKNQSSEKPSKNVTTHTNKAHDADGEEFYVDAKTATAADYRDSQTYDLPEKHTKRKK